MSVNEEFNYATIDNKASILSCSSQSKGCPVSNILSSNRKSIWLSEKEVPQTIIIDLSQITKKPKGQFKAWGIYCWHAYSTNPKVIELQSSQDNKNYISLGIFQLNIKAGTQIFGLNNISNKTKVNYIKIIVKETFGGNRTYINQFYLLDDINTTVPSHSIQKIQLTEHLTEGDSFFNNEEYKDEEDNSYEPIAPMREVKKYGIESIDPSARIITDEEEVVKEHNKATNPKKSMDMINQEDDMMNKERKMKKIEKILKAKLRNFSKPKVEQEEDAGSEEEGIEKHKPSSMNHQLTNIKPLNNKTISYNNQYDDNKLNQKTITSNTKREDSHNINTITYSNINQRRTLTPLKQNHNINYTTASKHIKEDETKDSEYKRLENQLKDMEEHLKSMNADSTIAYEKSLIHSKSSGYLQKDPYSISMMGMLSNNPFVYQSPPINNQPPVSKRMNELDAYLIDGNTEVNLPLQSDTRTPACNNAHLSNIHSIPPSQQTNRFQALNANANNNIYYDNNNRNDQLNDIGSNSKMNQIETKINKLESEIHDMKNNFDKLASNIQLLIKDNNSNSNSNNNNKSNIPIQQHNQNIINEQMISVLLTECAKMIEAKFSEYRSNNTSFIEGNNNNNLIMSHKANSIGSSNDYHLADSNISSFESRLNKKIEEKFDSLANNIQTQIYDKFLKPSILTIENTMRSNLEEIKQKVNLLNEQNNDSGSFIDSYHCSKSLQSSIISIGKSTQRRNEKIEEINAIGERLYDKLVEKEKKLNDLKKETTNYLKKKIKND